MATKSRSRCDLIIRLIDACLAELDASAPPAPLPVVPEGLPPRRR